jgi:AcrR family transcriptional regulator
MKKMPTEERREQITEAAIKIIGEQGLRAFTVMKVANEVGIKDSTIFRHFKSKDEIVSSVLDKLDTIMEETVFSEKSDPLERLGEFLMKRVTLLSNQPGVRSLVFSDQLIHAGGESGLERVTALRKKAQEHIESCLIEADQKNLLRAHLPLENILVIFHGMVMGLLFLAESNLFEDAVEQRTEEIWQTFLSMIRR